jgi:hypothetical protein
MPRCSEESCGRWRPERLAPRWAAGIRFNGQWYCSRSCVEHAARAGLDAPAMLATSAAALPPLRLGVLLRHMHVLSEEGLKTALDAHRASGRRLGTELQHLGLATREQVLRALAAQANVSYLTSFEISRVTNGPSWLPVETVRALGLVPFEVDTRQKKVRVLCTAPVPRSAVRALLKLTGWAPDVYLVDDEIWEDAINVYRPGLVGAPAREVVTVNDVDAAAALVAETAQIDRAVTMRHASCERYTWVRVEGPTRISDLLLPGEMEGTCQAAPTAH